ncbi:MAG: YiiD C-terminal domain-containing protein [Marinobacter sp.]|uniref:YiiD C-terminal domain-containing protein n=1 Tax=Marinobacter sp. TaxID=50741 RepID=UPI0034A01FEC
MMTQLARFRKRINEVIPLTRSLAVELVAYDGRQLLVSAPLEPNHNHQGTAFGGSLYSVAVVSAWGLVELLLADAGLTGNILIQSGEMDYLEPVEGDFYALCTLTDENLMRRFHKSLARYGKGRLNLTAQIFRGEASLTSGTKPLAAFRGRFVVQEARTDFCKL